MITHCRIAVSRWLSWLVFGRWVMFCALSEWHRWPIRHALNALFLDRRHCASAADWEALMEARSRQEALLSMECGFVHNNAVDEARRAGLL